MPFISISNTSLFLEKIHTFFYKQHFSKQRKAEIGKKIKQKRSNNLTLNFGYLKIIRLLHPSSHSKIIGDFLKMYKKTSAPVYMRLYD